MKAFMARNPYWSLIIVLAICFLVWAIFAPWPAWLVDTFGRKKIFLNALFNGITLGGLYFLVASGFTLIFGLMRNVNLAHGSLYLLGGYIGYEVGQGDRLVAAGFRRCLRRRRRDRRGAAGAGVSAHGRRGPAPDAGDHRHLHRHGRPDAVVLGRRLLPDPDAGLAVRPDRAAACDGGQAQWRSWSILKYPMVRLVILPASVVIGVAMWLLLNRTRIGMLIRAGVDDRDMLSATGVRIQLVFVRVFAFGAGLAGVAGVVGGTFQSLAPGEDIRFLLASLVVVIVGGMGSIPGAALGALLIGLAEQFGSVYMPTYAVVLTFLIMVVVLAFRPQGLMGRGARAMAVPEHASTAPRRASRNLAGPAGIERDPGPLLVRRPFLLVLPRPGRTFRAVPDLRLDVHPGHDRAEPDVPGRLRRHGQPGPDDGRGMRRLHGGDLRRQRDRPTISLGWPWWIAIPLALVIATAFGTLAGALAVRTEGIYTIMITLAIASAFFYFTRQNYVLFNGFSGLQRRRAAAAVRRRLARADAVLLPDPVLGGGLLSGGALRLPLAVRPGAAGRARQPAAHGGAGLQRHRAPDRGLCVCRLHRGGRRHPADLAERPDLAGHGGHRPGHRHPGDRRGRRPCATRSARSSARSST